MRKGVTIFLGVLVAALMLTSLLSAVHSEMMIAKNAALVVRSHPVLASDVTLSELEPEKYDAMIHSFQADNTTVLPESGQNSDLADTSETGLEQAIPASPALEEPGGNTTAADAHAASTAVDDAVHADDSDKTIEAEAMPRQKMPAPLYAAVEISNDSAIESAPPDTNDNNIVFTIQAASFTNKVNAENKYKSIIHDINGAALDNLRIEKVGDYYTVRLGRFDHYVTAMKFLNAMNSRLSSAIVLKAYIKNERIIALHNSALLAGN